jgi:PIN domain nuclease of toxin-antitoxin system
VERTEKAEIVYLDTHVLLWLHDGLVDRLSDVAIDVIEKGRLYYSPMVELELQYLHEIGRFRPNSEQAIQALAKDIGLRRGGLGFSEVVTTAVALDWTRDPFDRLIVAEAMRVGAKLVTKDATIQKNYPDAVW